MIVEQSSWLKPSDRRKVSRRLGDYLRALPPEGLQEALARHQEDFEKKRSHTRRPEQMSFLSEEISP